ncbi:Crotonobetainyl-CoA:carnitine CoA-transferase CaiB [Thalassovita litoralis]|jgi:crotonobetainyl-CoA:carnitine CoA-transferase CaiB-like acyl-CoA transferase|uniref:Crotonobetainyl-CoA:carnitine CoA-transferase CaiB n=1 Tax=Thalassovita litoralis TaxID=1010611 RepID=A0A521BLN2_9RHOB|nr:CoA transferase [Thalassovita litoralis]SMO47550.1 Crotonobetainyl-CoA:carnitine CoA-transferase CaiB [Thalassovita litoralis]
MGPLAGVRILDLTTVLMGPYATQILGDFGADVIKVESPDGDVVRQIGPARHPDMGPLFMNVNRSKRDIALDLKRPEARPAILKLVEQADVLVTNIRPRAMARLGLSYEELAELNPRLIYAALVGYDQTGPYADRPAYDDLIQGGSCIAHGFVRAGGQPSYVPAAVADRIVGMAGVNAILAAVIERMRSGQGQKIEIPMFETMVSMIMGDHMGGLTFDPPLDQGGYARHLSPDRRPYQTQDGYVCALIYTDGHWQRFFDAIGRGEMFTTDDRFSSFTNRMANIDFVYSELGKIIRTKTTAEWLDIFERADVPAMPMHSYESVMQDPHLVATGFFDTIEHPSEGTLRQMAVPVSFSRTPVKPSRPAPRLGEHGAEILAEAGFSDDDIAQMQQNGALCAMKKD